MVGRDGFVSVPARRFSYLVKGTIYPNGIFVIPRLSGDFMAYDKYVVSSPNGLAICSCASKERANRTARLLSELGHWDEGYWMSSKIDKVSVQEAQEHNKKEYARLGIDRDKAKWVIANGTPWFKGT